MTTRDEIQARRARILSVRIHDEGKTPVFKHIPNANFIAHAPTDIDFLLAENERWESKMEKLRELLNILRPAVMKPDSQGQPAFARAQSALLKIDALAARTEEGG